MMTKNKKGQALVTLLVFTAVAITITSAAVVATIANIKATSSLTYGDQVLLAAEGAVENAVLQVIRNPAYTGETMVIDGINVTVTVTGASTKTIIADATTGVNSRKIQAIVNNSSNVYTLNSWLEIDD